MATAPALSDGATKRAVTVAALIVVVLVAVGVADASVGWGMVADDADQVALGWGLVAVGALLVLLGVRRLLVVGRAVAILRSRPWNPGTLAAAYPKRRRLAIQLDPDLEEHLVLVARGSVRAAARLDRKSAIVAAGRGRSYVIASAEGRRSLVLGRMDVPLDRLHLINPGAAPDRFDDQPDAREVF